MYKFLHLGCEEKRGSVVDSSLLRLKIVARVSNCTGKAACTCNKSHVL